jgi:hypothetical protein
MGLIPERLWGVGICRGKMLGVFRRLFTIASALSLLLCVATVVLWLRGRTGYDEAAWTYDRYLPDGSAASSQVYLTSNERLWLSVNWGRVGPYDGHLVWGYYMNIDQSGGRPLLRFYHDPYDAMQTWIFATTSGGTTGFGPLRWLVATRSKAKDGDDHHEITLGVSHWLLAVLLLVAPLRWLYRFRRGRRARIRGLCPACGYDLRASKVRCPECGTPVISTTV